MNNIAIINAEVLPMEGMPLRNGFVWIQNGKIAALGEMKDFPARAAEVPTWDAAGGYVLPGLVDAHSHIGLYEDGLGFEGADGNEDTDPVTPHMRALDGINPMERAFREAWEAGVTSVVVSPGSANPIGGQLVAMKTYGRRVDDMVLCQPVAMKMALGENPKTTYHDKDASPVTRMATAAIIREHLEKATEYMEKKLDEEADPPEFDAKLEAMLPVVKREIPVHFHAHRADDMFTALRIAKEFQLKAVLVHGTEGYLVADLWAQESVPIISGPLMTDRSKPELVHQTERAPAILTKAGILTAISNDHPETPEKYLLQTAMVAVKAGMAEEEALRAITINGARIAGIADRVGSLCVGKDGDVVIYSGHPFDYKSSVQAVFCEGCCIYRRNEE